MVPTLRIPPAYKDIQKGITSINFVALFWQSLGPFPSIARRQTRLTRSAAASSSICTLALMFLFVLSRWSRAHDRITRRWGNEGSLHNLWRFGINRGCRNGRDGCLAEWMRIRRTCVLGLDGCLRASVCVPSETAKSWFSRAEKRARGWSWESISTSCFQHL